MATTDAVLNTIDANLDASTGRLFDLLRIKSVSTDPAFTGECVRAADWLADQLKGLGYEAEVRDTPGHPIVVGHAKAKRKDAPHVLFYGHYDVQPPDPLELWETDPFEPRLAEGEQGKEIVARGASDDKGQLMTFLEACRAFEANGGLPCHVTFLFEGEEETGSPSLPEFLATNKDELSTADLALVCDTGMWNADDAGHHRHAARPRAGGSGHPRRRATICIRACSAGRSINPIHVLAKIIADLHDADGTVDAAGLLRRRDRKFPKISPSNGAISNSTKEKFSAEVGLTQRRRRERARRHGADLVASDLRRQRHRRRLYRQGHQDRAAGAGLRQILVPPRRQAGRRRRSSKASAPSCASGCRPTSRWNSPRTAPPDALQLPFGSEALTRARRALHEEWDKEAALVGCGGSIPIVGAFKRDLEHGRADDRLRARRRPHSFAQREIQLYELFHKGARSWARVLARWRGNVEASAIRQAFGAAG